MIHDPDAVVRRAVRMVSERTVIATDGGVVRLEADTICVHGDTPGSGKLAAKVRRGLEEAGITGEGARRAVRRHSDGRRVGLMELALETVPPSERISY